MQRLQLHVIQCASQIFAEDKSFTSTLSAELGSGTTSDVKAALKKEVKVFEQREKLVRDIKVN